MSGFGERFRRVGYTVPKPLIEVEGKPIVAHVIDLFPGENNFLFICNQTHLDNPLFQMREILSRYCPTGKIIGIAPHQLGPINAVLKARQLIDLKEPTVVNYCDFTCYWDWENFKEFVSKTACQGAIPAYKGFHPHTLGSTNYAYLLEKDGWVKGIQEKQPYTENRMQEYASSGTYYFSTGALMLDSFESVMEQNDNVGGEYYVSLAYKPIISNGGSVAVYPLQHFMQWGTPEDLAEYKMWSMTFRSLMRPHESSKPQGALVIPMAGLGQRFVNEGYTLTKPLIPVSGKPMVLQATNDLPKAEHYQFILRRDMPEQVKISGTLQEEYLGAGIEIIEGITEGQACTALIGLNVLESSLKGRHPLKEVTFGTCDNGVIYNAELLQKLLDNREVDVIVWGARGHTNATRHPKMFGWIDANQDGLISKISVKESLKDPSTDPIIIGTFTFKKADDVRLCIDALISRDGRVNGEFYLDSCINDAIKLGLRCYLFEVENFISWGTPNDLRTFEYWQSCFDKWNSHPYKIELDARVPKSGVDALINRYQSDVPRLPGAERS